MPVMMGRKTFESMGGKALPGRKNIIITRQHNWKAKDVIVVNAYSDALFVSKQTDCNEVFLIGGGELFKQVIDKADRIYMTRVHTVVDGDVFFPDIDKAKWNKVSNRDCFADDRHAFDFTFEVWEKK